MKKTLVAYYSWSQGNTERIAKALASAIGGDLVKLETAAPYRGSYDDVVQQGQEEVERGFLPQIKPLGVDLSDYDVVAVGTPTWWYTMAPAVHTFVSGADWAGKTVIPFMTNGGWPGHVIRDIRAACAGARFAPSMEVRFDSTGGARMVTKEAAVDAWIASVKNALDEERSV